MKIFRRPFYAWVALLGLVYAQLAVSAYACPRGLEPAPSGEAVAMAAAEDMAGMHCAEMGAAGADTNVSALCVQHCDQGNQTVGSSQPPDFQPTLFLLPTFALADADDAAREAVLKTPLQMRVTSPPPLWRTGRLRI